MMRVNYLQRYRRVFTVTIYGVMSLMPRITGAILMLVYTRIFSLSDYGIYGILGSLVLILEILSDLGVPPAIVRNYCDRQNDPDAARAYLSSIIRGSRILSLFVLPVIGVLLFLLWDFVHIGREYVWYLVPLLLATAFLDRSSEVFAAICRVIERPGYYAVGKFIQGNVTIVAAIAIVFWWNGGVVGALLALLISRAASSWAYQLVLPRGIALGYGPINWQEVRDCLAFGLPLVPNRLASWLRQPALKPILAHLVPLSSVGVFSLASAVASLPLVISSAVDLALSPHYFKRRVDGTPDFTAKILVFSRLYIGCLFPIWVVAVAFCPTIIRLFAAPQFIYAAPATAALFCSAFARFQHPFLQRQIEFLRVTWLIPWVTISGTGLTLVLTLGLAGTYGITAVAWAIALSDVIILVGLACVIRYYERLDYPLALSLSMLLFLVALAIWVGFQEPFPLGMSSFFVKLFLVIGTCALSYAFLVRPNRAFIGQLLRG